MPEWIRATRTTPGYYADEVIDTRTCRQRQDELLSELKTTLAQASADIADLQWRVADLEAKVARTMRARTASQPPSQTASQNQTYTWVPGGAWDAYTAEMDAAYIHSPGYAQEDAA